MCKVIAGSDDSLDYRQPMVQDAVGFMTGVRGVGAGVNLRGGCRECKPPLKMTCSFLIQLVFCKIWRYVFSAVHIMLFPSQTPSSYYSLFKVFFMSPVSYAIP